MSKLLYIICCCIINAAAFLSSMLGRQWQFFLISVLLFFGGIVLLSKNPFKTKAWGYVLLFGPLLLSMSGALILSFFVEGFVGYPVAIYTLIAIFISVYTVNKANNKKFISVIFTLTTIVLATLLPNLHNYISYQKQDNSIINNTVSELVIFDSFQKRFNLAHQKKIIVLDVWDSSCGVCIEQFPKFEKIVREFENDTTIAFYSLNLPQTKDNRKKVASYTDPYSFKALYADANVKLQLKIESIPKYIIIDKNSKIRYIGNLNIGELDFYNNFYDLLSKIK